MLYMLVDSPPQGKRGYEIVVLLGQSGYIQAAAQWTLQEGEH